MGKDESIQPLTNHFLILLNPQDFMRVIRVFEALHDQLISNELRI